MKFTAAQIAQMVIFGMTANATEDQQKEFFNKLSAGLQAQIIALGATPPEEDEQESDGEKKADTTQEFEKRMKAVIEADRKAAADAETKRRADIRKLATAAKLSEAFVNNCIAEQMTMEQVTEAALKALGENNPPVSGVRVGDDLAMSSLGPAIQDALLARTNTPLYQMERGDRQIAIGDDGKPKRRAAHERARQFRGMTLMELTRAYLNMVGVDTADMSRQEIAKAVFDRRMMNRVAGGLFAAHSTSDFDNILANVLNKTLRARFIEWQPTWTQWCREASTPDFKQIQRTQLSGVGTPPLVYEGGEYTYATKTDSKEVYLVYKYGQLFAITWEALINDDLSAFDRVPASMVAAALRKEDDLAYAILTANANMSDGNALFDATNHSNYTSSGTALSVTSLAVGQAAMRSQTGLNSSERLDIMPKFLIVPVAKEVLAQQLISSTVDPAKSNATMNPFNNKLTVIANPRLDTDSSTKWYLAASPSQIDTVEVCFLEGSRQPVLEERPGWEVDGREFKIRHVIGAKAIDWRGLYRNAGA